jgi:hypothetical protein
VVRGQGQRVFKFALVGCGGRGSGAARDIVKAAEGRGFRERKRGVAARGQGRPAGPAREGGIMLLGGAI